MLSTLTKASLQPKLLMIKKVIKKLRSTDPVSGGNCQKYFACLLKRVYFKRKQFAVRVDPFSEGTLYTERNQEVSNVVFFNFYHSLGLFSKKRIADIFLIFPENRV